MDNYMIIIRIALLGLLGYMGLIFGAEESKETFYRLVVYANYASLRQYKQNVITIETIKTINGDRSTAKTSQKEEKEIFEIDTTNRIDVNNIDYAHLAQLLDNRTAFNVVVKNRNKNGNIFYPICQTEVRYWPILWYRIIRGDFASSKRWPEFTPTIYSNSNKPDSPDNLPVALCDENSVKNRDYSLCVPFLIGTFIKVHPYVNTNCKIS